MSVLVVITKKVFFDIIFTMFNLALDSHRVIFATDSKNVGQSQRGVRNFLRVVGMKSRSQVSNVDERFIQPFG